MTLLPILEVAISLALLYLFFSQVVSSGFELIASISNKRGRYLRQWLNKALNSGNDKNWAELFYRHPSVDMLAKSANRPAPYVPSSVFAKAIVDLVIDEARDHRFVAVPDATGQPTGDVVYQVTDPLGDDGKLLTPLRQLREGLKLVSEGDFKALLRTTLLNAEGCSRQGTDAEADAKVFEQFIHGLAVWYDNYMDRVGGWYKRHIRLPLFLVGLVVAVACNLDSVYVGRYFWHHSEERERVADYAAQVARQPLPPDTPVAQLPPRQQVRRFINRTDSLTKGLQRHGFPIGWTIAAAADSVRLPASFFVYQPAAVVSPGWCQWLRSCLS